MNQVVYTNSSLEIDKGKIKSFCPYLRSGYYGSAYRLGDSVIKILHQPGTMEQYEMISAIKDLRLPHFYHIYEVLSNERLGLKTYAGTISSYYPQEKVNLWTSPSSFVIENFRALLDSACTLGVHGIQLYDLDSRNMILNCEGITVIDVDHYYFSHKDSSRINYYTMRQKLIDLLIENYGESSLLEYPISMVRKELEELSSFDSFQDYSSPLELVRSKLK